MSFLTPQNLYGLTIDVNQRYRTMSFDQSQINWAGAPSSQDAIDLETNILIRKIRISYSMHLFITNSGGISQSIAAGTQQSKNNMVFFPKFKRNQLFELVANNNQLIDWVVDVENVFVYTDATYGFMYEKSAYGHYDFDNLELVLPIKDTLQIQYYNVPLQLGPPPPPTREFYIHLTVYYNDILGV